MRFLLSLSVLLLAGAGTLPSTAQEAVSQEDAAPRTFLVELGRPGLEVEVNGTAYEADEHGTLRLELPVAPQMTLRFRSLNAAWTLDAVRTVPDESADVAVYWNLASELRPTKVTPAPSPPPPDPCRSSRSLRCRQARWTRFEEALDRQDCAAVLATIRELETGFPEMLTAGPAVAAFAQARLQCGLSAGDEAQIRRAVEQASSYRDGELWCEPAGSRLLARGFEALEELDTAADSAAAARRICGAESTVPLEWEFYFRLRSGEVERMAALAAEAPGRLRPFLEAWLDSRRGECRSEVELEASGDLPCRGLPQDFCSRQYGRILLACGNERADFATASRYLRSALPADPATWNELPGSRQLTLELAEAELLSGDAASAVRHYERLLQTGGADGAEDPALWRLYGDALVLSGEPSRAAAAYDGARRGLEAGSVDYAVVINNLCVLGAGPSEAQSDAPGLEVLESAVRELPEDEERLRVWLLHNLLSLRIRRLERESDLDAQEKLARLEELRGPFTDYQRRLAALAADGPVSFGAGSGVSLEMFDGRRFALVLP